MFFSAGHFQKKPGFFAKRRGWRMIWGRSRFTYCPYGQAGIVIFKIWRPKYRDLDFDLNVKNREV
jgi:hypothetical protein